MKIIIKNKKAYFDYEILEKFEAGIKLFGFEVKAVKEGKINLTGSYILIRNNEAYLINATISPYQIKNTPNWYDPKKSRKLLLKKQEINYLNGLLSQKKYLTLIPLHIYIARGKIKLEFGIAKKKKKYDKRELLKKRTIEKEIKRESKNWG